MHKAMLWEKIGGGKVHCFLCSHHCKIQEGKRGVCHVRVNEGGELFSTVYDRVIARSVDPIEKKPLFHFYPASKSYSIATPGCNFRCMHCQNADISQMPREIDRVAGEPMSPESIVAEAVRHGCRSISYTYTEPTIFFELAYDTAKLASSRGIKNVFVTNGYITKEALDVIRPYLDAANIDIKGFRDDFYRKVCGARLQPVLDAIKHYHDAGIWIELTTLVIPGHNDSPEELREIARFIASVDVEIPWHVTQFHPTYKLTDQPRTPVETLRAARQIGFDSGLQYVYEGNVPGEGGENTYCPKCGELLIARFGYSISRNTMAGGKCGKCGHAIAGAGL